jgi:hypothetical protein
MTTPERMCAGRHTPPVPAKCPLCWRWEFDPSYRGSHGGDPADARAADVPDPSPVRKRPAAGQPAAAQPCRNLGPPTGTRLPLMNCRADPPNTAPLRACSVHGTCTESQVARGTQCCRFCSDHTGRRAPASAALVTVPPPPPLAASTRSPRSDRAVVTVVVGEEAGRLFAVSGPLMRAYADRVGADLVVLDWPGHPGWPMSSKFAIPTVLDHYQRIAYVDADTLLRPGCVNLFEMCEKDEFGACDELPFHRRQPQYGVEARYRQFSAAMGFGDPGPPPWYMNAGVMVVPQTCQRYLRPPARPTPTDHCSEQDHTNASILAAVRAKEVRVRLLDRRANWQNWTDYGFRTAPADAILHWSGAGGNRVSRADDMAAWARRVTVPA